MATLNQKEIKEYIPHREPFLFIDELTDIEKLALKSLEQGTNSNVPQASINLSDWRNHFYAGHTGDNNDTKKKAFSRVRQSLVSKGILSVHNNIKIKKIDSNFPTDKKTSFLIINPAPDAQKHSVESSYCPISISCSKNILPLAKG